MNKDRRHDFDEALLTGYLDGMLNQSKEQLVSVHLEDCAECRAQLGEMERIREATMSTTFRSPADDQWDEGPRGDASRVSRGLGWMILGAWIVALTGFVIGRIWQESESLFEALLAFGGISGVLLLLVSVGLDRLKTMKTDRYRGVEK